MSDPISGVSQLMKLSVSASEAVQVMRMQRLWWCLPAVVLCVADGLLTLWGQPVAYWSGGFAVVREGNPLAAWLLSVHPLAFAAAGVPYLLVVLGTVMVLPRRWAVAAAVGVALAHAFAVGVWFVVPLC